MTISPATRVEVNAYARLHLGFLDLQGGLGRRFGSLGLTIDGLATRLSASRAAAMSASGPCSERALRYACAYAEGRGLGAARLVLHQVIPEHAGLGSGTQMALAVGTALDRLEGHERDARAVAHALNRGARSGIGIGTFAQGGFVVDCGRGEHDTPPPIALRLPVPKEWRFLLLLDHRVQGLHGAAEIAAFARLPEFPETTAGRLCRLLMMKLVPGLLGPDFPAFAEAVGEIQRLIGNYFAPAQGGCFTSPAVAEALAWLEGQGVKGSGQSSWGPTGYVLAENDAMARRLERDLKRRFGELSPLRYQIVAPRNQGAIVNVVREPLRLDREKLIRER
jgi:beta-ribofuranosylaminobenzene 5'-phosphate synthase